MAYGNRAGKVPKVSAASVASADTEVIENETQQEFETFEHRLDAERFFLVFLDASEEELFATTAQDAGLVGLRVVLMSTIPFLLLVIGILELLVIDAFDHARGLRVRFSLSHEVQVDSSLIHVATYTLFSFLLCDSTDHRNSIRRSADPHHAHELGTSSLHRRLLPTKGEDNARPLPLLVVGVCTPHCLDHFSRGTSNAAPRQPQQQLSMGRPSPPLPGTAPHLPSAHVLSAAGLCDGTKCDRCRGARDLPRNDPQNLRLRLRLLRAAAEQLDNGGL